VRPVRLAPPSGVGAAIDLRVSHRFARGGSPWLGLWVQYAPVGAHEDLRYRRVFGDFPLVGATGDVVDSFRQSPSVFAPLQRANVPEQQLYLSFVVCGRDDGYSEGFTDRVMNHLDILFYQLVTVPDLARAAEVLIVDWNPPLGHRLAALVRKVRRRHPALAELEGRASAIIRLLQVGKAVAASPGPMFKKPFCHARCLNIGVRRANGRFVLMWNFDDVASPALLRFLASRTLREDSFYTSGLWFDPIPLPAAWTAAQKLRVISGRSLVDSLHKGSPLESAVLARPENLPYIVEQFDGLCEAGDSTKSTSNTSPSKRHNYFAGDFLLAPYDAWAEARGLYELPFSHGTDGSMLCKLWARGLRQVVLLPPCRVLHQHHEREPPPREVLLPQDLCDAAFRRQGRPPGVPSRDPEDWGHPGADGPGLVEEEAVL